MLDTTQQVSQKEFYEANGYVVLRNLISLNLIDRVLNSYKTDIVQSKYPFFRQNTYTYEPNKLTKFGYVKQSFLDIHDYKKFPQFSKGVREILCSDIILNALRQIGDSHSFNLMQGMLFDANTETQPHQEWWYLDTVPNGHLTIAWIALEDIDERAGRFYVLPKAIDNLDFHTDKPDLSHAEWLKRIRKYVDDNSEQVVAPDLKKGDVLLLNSATIHGSLLTQDASFSRKSLTAHYIPSEYEFGNLFKTRHINYKTYKGMKYYKAHPDYSVLTKLKFEANQSLYKFPLLVKILHGILKRQSR